MYNIIIILQEFFAFTWSIPCKYEHGIQSNSKKLDDETHSQYIMLLW